MKNKPEYRPKVAYQYAEANKTPTRSVMKRKQLNKKAATEIKRMCETKSNYIL